MTARRHRPCDHVGYELTAAYTLTGVGCWRAIVWCEKCGALGFRDHDGAETLAQWRRPTSRSRRALTPRPAGAVPRRAKCAHHWEHREIDSRRQCIVCGKLG